MKRFLWKFLLVVTVLVVLIPPLNRYVRASWEYNNNRPILAFQEKPYPLDVINLGTSHAMFGYAFKPLGLSHLDLALPSQTIEYDLKMLRAFDRHLKPGGVVLISLSQITFANADIGRKENYYDVLDRADIEPVSDFDYYTYTHVPALHSGSVYTTLARETRDFRFATHRPWENGGLAYSKRKYEMVEAEYAAAVRNQDIEANVQHVKKLLAYCEARGYRAVLTMEPVHASYLAYFDEAAMERLVFHQLDAIEPDVPFLNYMDDARFRDNQALFHNPDHLNGKGRALLSSLVYEELGRLGYL